MVTKLQPQTPITVDGEGYIVQLYSPTFGFTLYAKLLRLLGEPLVKLMGVAKGQESFLNTDLKNLDLDAVAEAFQALFSKLAPEDFVPLMKEILSSTFFAQNLTPVSELFETSFSGRYLHVFKLVAKTLGAQYPDFLGVIAKRAKGAQGEQGTKVTVTKK